MPTIEYYVDARTDGQFVLNGKPLSNNLKRIASKKGGNDTDRFLKDFLEVIDVLTLPIGFVETNCLYMYKQYLITKGKYGWTKKDTNDFLLKLKRSQKYVNKLLETAEREAEAHLLGVELKNE